MTDSHHRTGPHPRPGAAAPLRLALPLAPLRLALPLAPLRLALALIVVLAAASCGSSEATDAPIPAGSDTQVSVTNGPDSTAAASSTQAVDEDGAATTDPEADADADADADAGSGTATSGDDGDAESSTARSADAEVVTDPVSGCEPGTARIDTLSDALPPELEQVRQAILEAYAACDLDGLVALTDPAARVSDPDDEAALVLNFGDQELMPFDQLPFPVLPVLLNGSWTADQSDAGTATAVFADESYEIEISSDGYWTMFLIVVS